ITLKYEPGKSDGSTTRSPDTLQGGSDILAGFTDDQKATAPVAEAALAPVTNLNLVVSDGTAGENDTPPPAGSVLTLHSAATTEQVQDQLFAIPDNLGGFLA